jgi:hypothetical protein
VGCASSKIGNECGAAANGLYKLYTIGRGGEDAAFRCLDGSYGMAEE